jgi:hypothetical protein
MFRCAGGLRMKAWLGRLTRQRRPQRDDGLRERLRAYPPYAAPHAGPPAALTNEQAQQNLAYLLNQREHRMSVLATWMDGEAIDIRPALNGADPMSLLYELHHWANAHWPALHDPKIATVQAWLRSRRSHGEIVYSLLMDIAVLLGELISRRHAGYRWSLDLDATSGRNAARSHRRPVMRLVARGAMPSTVVLDLEDLVVDRYLHPDYVTHRMLNDWATVVGDAMSGGYETAWQATLAGQH